MLLPFADCRFVTPPRHAVYLAPRHVDVIDAATRQPATPDFCHAAAAAAIITPRRHCRYGAAPPRHAAVFARRHAAPPRDIMSVKRDTRYMAQIRAN
jgi:hypothetical protein